MNAFTSSVFRVSSRLFYGFLRQRIVAESPVEGNEVLRFSAEDMRKNPREAKSQTTSDVQRLPAPFDGSSDNLPLIGIL
jgi:hypothetical protein